MIKFLALALLAAAATPAIATETPRSVIVRTGDLDLAKAADIATLDRRLNKAAHSVCDTAGIRGAFEARAEAACRKQALADAQPNRDAMVASARGTELAVVTTR
jgi:UrcA family protein